MLRSRNWLLKSRLWRGSANTLHPCLQLSSSSTWIIKEVFMCLHRSELERYEESLRDYKKIQRLLFKLSPLEWQESKTKRGNHVLPETSQCRRWRGILHILSGKRWEVVESHWTDGDGVWCSDESEEDSTAGEEQQSDIETQPSSAQGDAEWVHQQVISNIVFRLCSTFSQIHLLPWILLIAVVWVGAFCFCFFKVLGAVGLYVFF